MILRSHKMHSNQTISKDARPKPEQEEDLLDDGSSSTAAHVEERKPILTDYNAGDMHDSADMDGRKRAYGSRVTRRSMKVRLLNVDVVTVVYINMFFYSTCFWIQTGVLPYLTRSLNLDTVAFGYLQTMFHLIQLIGGPLFGRFADLYGGRVALSCAFVSAAVMYGTLGAATSSFGVFISRVPSLFLHAYHASQMIIVDATDPSKRAAALGRISLSYGLGMVIGPLIGGQIASKFSEQCAAFVACAGSILSVAIVLKFIPANTKDQSRVTSGKHVNEESKSSEGVFSISKMISLLTQSPGAIFFLFYMLISGAPSNLFQSMLSVITMETFALTSDQTGFLLSITGVISMLVQGIGIGILTKRFSDSSILNGSIILLLASYLLLCFVSDIKHLVCVLILMTCGQSVIGTLLTSSLTKTVSVTDTGTMLGLGHACQSLVSTISPTIGAYLLEQFGITSFGIVGVVVYTLLLLTPKS
ncbi:solute carrier family 22 member 18-like [Anneissia japonica]|uniref:solute carrier family 22 member 18-like n=1 Tax=Anneissia japonica TaxID=1529436 RepID=UPI0014254DE4|nr:solute carrier family 22 member 18-like [Anneissia japonica]